MSEMELIDEAKFVFCFDRQGDEMLMYVTAYDDFQAERIPVPLMDVLGRDLMNTLSVYGVVRKFGSVETIYTLPHEDFVFPLRKLFATFRSPESARLKEHFRSLYEQVATEIEGIVNSAPPEPTPGG